MARDLALQEADDALEAGDFEAVRRVAQRLLAEDAEDLDALELLGHAAAGEGDTQTADEAFARLIAAEPKSPAPLLLAADVKIRQPGGDDRARVEEGLALLAKAEPRARKEPALKAQLELLRGLGASQLGAFEDALAAFDRVLELEPEHDEARLERGIALFELGRFTEARKTFEALTRDLPDEAWGHHYLGLLAERRGESPQRWFEQARALSPDEFPPPVHLDGPAFDRAVKEAIDALPEHARPHLANAIVTVAPLPDDEEIREGLSPTILGVFHGTPVDERLDTHAGHHQTARITLFQKNLERFARTREELLEEIRVTILHEVGHLLGLDEDELYERGLD